MEAPEPPHPVLLPQSRLGEIATQSGHIRQQIWQWRRDAVASASYSFSPCGRGSGEGGVKEDSISRIRYYSSCPRLPKTRAKIASTLRR
jgi:hypothetical protein